MYNHIHSIYDELILSVSTWLKSTAVITKDMRLTYAQLLKRIDDVYKQLIERGIHPLDKVAWIDNTSTRFIEAFYATARAGAVGVPLDIHAPAEEWIAQCQAYDVKFFLVPPDIAEKALKVFEAYMGLLNVIILHLEEDSSTLQDIAQRTGTNGVGDSQPSDALILSTSGTTGKPKGVVLTHANLIANQKSVREYMKIVEQDTMLVVKPLFHSSTLIEMLSLLNSGGQLVIAPWLSARGVLSKMVQERCNILCVVPTMAQEILRYLQSHPDNSLALRALSVSGSPIASEVLCNLAKYLSNGGIFHAYGLTEAAPRVSALLPHELFKKSDSVGRAIPSVEVAIVGEDGRDLCAGQVGKIVIRGPNIMRGYYRDPISTAEVIHDSRLYTHDLAVFDEDKYIYLRGRSDDLINCGGQKVYPYEVEQVLMKHPSIKDAIVYGQADERLGQIPVTRLVSANDMKLSVNEIRNYCLQYLAYYKIPRQVDYCSSLPRTALGKVKRFDLSNKPSAPDSL